jgi:hypothetical protein
MVCGRRCRIGSVGGPIDGGLGLPEVTNVRSGSNQAMRKAFPMYRS